MSVWGDLWEELEEGSQKTEDGSWKRLNNLKIEEFEDLKINE
jgi:hypothetical protein